MRTQLLANPPEWKYRRAGYLTEGTPTNLHVVRSMRTGLSRRIAMGSGPQRELQELELQLSLAERNVELAPLELAALRTQVEALRQRIARIPFLDPFDLRYRNRVKVPMPVAKAVMFCVMDVSGSMDEARKDIAKRFFILLYLFLTRHYEQTDVVFIRHHTQAAEVEEEEFFQSTESGGTVVSSALKLMHEIIEARYRGSEWNIYGAQGVGWRQLAAGFDLVPSVAERQAAAPHAATSPTCRLLRKTRTCGTNTVRWLPRISASPCRRSPRRPTSIRYFANCSRRR